MVEKIERDPFDVDNPLDRALLPSATREIMFAFLSRDRTVALTPQDMLEQTRNMRSLCQKIDFLLTGWDPKRVPYWEILSRIDTAIQRHNIHTRGIRERGDQAAEERRLAQVKRRKLAAPRFGVERVKDDAA